MSTSTASLHDMAYGLVGVAWPGLDNDQRNDVIDTLFYSEYLNALEVLLTTKAPLPQALADQARAALQSQPA